MLDGQAKSVGLSMDDQVLLLSRIRERFTESGDTTAAVVFALGSTARIITGAALIIVAPNRGQGRARSDPCDEIRPSVQSEL